MHQSYRSSRRSTTVLRRNGRGIRSPDNPCLTELTQVRQTCTFLDMIRIDWVYKDPPRRWNLPYSNRIQIGVKNELMYLGNKLLVNARSAPATKNPLEGVRVWGVVRGGFRLIPSFLDHRWGPNFQSRWGWGGPWDGTNLNFVTRKEKRQFHDKSSFDKGTKNWERCKLSENFVFRLKGPCTKSIFFVSQYCSHAQKYSRIDWLIKF